MKKILIELVSGFVEIGKIDGLFYELDTYGNITGNGFEKLSELVEFLNS